MGSKYWLILLMLSIAMVVGLSSSETSSLHDSVANWGLITQSGHDIDIDDEMMMDSETNRRLLAQGGRHISYAALRANSVPCNRRGQSYYNCNSRQRANPYRRGCTAITRCKRLTH